MMFPLPAIAVPVVAYTHAPMVMFSMIAISVVVVFDASIHYEIILRHPSPAHSAEILANSRPAQAR